VERKHFLAAAGAIVAALSAAGVASGASLPVPVNTASPGPSASPYYRRRGERGSHYDLRHADRAIEHIIDRLQRDQTDDGGHRIAAIADLQQARAQIAAALQYGQTHPNSTTVNPLNSTIPADNLNT
jgi:hypothetical protein